jgi:hypothetical protein
MGHSAGSGSIRLRVVSTGVPRAHEPEPTQELARVLGCELVGTDRSVGEGAPRRAWWSCHGSPVGGLRRLADE